MFLNKLKSTLFYSYLVPIIKTLLTCCFHMQFLITKSFCVWRPVGSVEYHPAHCGIFYNTRIRSWHCLSRVLRRGWFSTAVRALWLSASLLTEYFLNAGTDSTRGRANHRKTPNKTGGFPVGFSSNLSCHSFTHPRHRRSFARILHP